MNSKNYASAYQTLEEVPGPLVREKIQKHQKKLKVFLKNCLNSWYQNLEKHSITSMQ